MTTTHKLLSPLVVPVSAKTKFILNLNNYRNAHFQVLNKAKKQYEQLMTQQLRELPCFAEISITYVLYPKTKRLTDISNVLSIHDKFFCDCLVNAGKLPDDNYEYLRSIDYRMGDIDSSRPRVEVIITNLG